MSKMKYVLELIQEDEYYNLRYEVKKAQVTKNTELVFRGETLSIKKAEAILTLMKSHINSTH
jgi:hypothetical protein